MEARKIVSPFLPKPLVARLSHARWMVNHGSHGFAESAIATIVKGVFVLGCWGLRVTGRKRPWGSLLRFTTHSQNSKDATKTIRRRARACSFLQGWCDGGARSLSGCCCNSGRFWTGTEGIICFEWSVVVISFISLGISVFTVCDFIPFGVRSLFTLRFRSFCSLPFFSCLLDAFANLRGKRTSPLYAKTDFYLGACSFHSRCTLLFDL